MNKLIIIATLLSVFLRLSSAAYSTTAASFSIAPVQVVSSADTNFQATENSLLFLTRTTSSNMLALWSLVGNTATPSVYTLYRRYIRATDLTKNGADTQINIGIKSNDSPFYSYSPDGYVGVVSSNTVTSGNYDLYLTTFAASISTATDATTTRITTSTGTSVQYGAAQFWADDSYWYVVYYETNANLEPVQIYVQGYEIEDATKTKFSSPVKLATTALTGSDPSSVDVVCGQTPAISGIVCMWRQDTQGKIVYGFIDTTKSSPTVTESTLLTDSTYYPNRIIAGSGYYVALVEKDSSRVTTGFSIQISSSSTFSGTLSSLPITQATGYAFPSIEASSYYYSNWLLITRQVNTAGTGSQVQLQLYDNKGQASGSSVALVTDGSIPQALTLSNQAFYVLINDSPQNSAPIANAYIGQIYSNVGALSASSILNSMFALALLASIAIFLL